MNIWQTFLAMTASVSLAVAPLIAPANATQKTPLQNRGEVLLAQAEQIPGNCRRVNTNNSPLNVRSSPNGRVIGTLAKGTTIQIQTLGDWVQVVSPVQGYVSANYLALCTQPIPPSETNTVTDNCRRVVSFQGTSVRTEPSVNGSVAGRLIRGQRVTIINRGANGWVPLSAPINGYITANTLGLCV